MTQIGRALCAFSGTSEEQTTIHPPAISLLVKSKTVFSDEWDVRGRDEKSRGQRQTQAAWHNVMNNVSERTPGRHRRQHGRVPKPVANVSSLRTISLSDGGPRRRRDARETRPGWPTSKSGTRGTLRRHGSLHLIDDACFARVRRSPALEGRNKRLPQ